MFLRLALALFFAALLTPLAACAQSYGRSTSSANLSQLPTSEQVRIIENEYRQHSGGRSIPDNQLDFYLDQVRYSRWNLGQVRADIARSTRGANNWRPPGSGWNQREVTCTSVDRQYRECRTPYNGPAQLVQQISDTRCIEGRNWGSRPGLIWVDDGCRARFAESRQGWPSWGAGGNQREILCESKDERYRQCNTGFRGPARLVRQLSDSPCIEGRSWGQAPGMVWVSRGCRARFQDSRWSGGTIGSGYSILCSSTDGRRRNCAWNPRYGRPYLIEQISDTRCVEGRNWGYAQGTLWVDDGCRGRFGAR